MPAHQNYLLIIDEAQENFSLSEYFAKFNFEIRHYSSIEQIKETETPFAILVHLQLLDCQFQLLQSLYKQYTIPLIVINNELKEDMCIKALEAGADDFLIKPIYPRELHARLNAINRRIQRRTKNMEQEAFVFENWKLYSASRQLFNKFDQEIVLSAGEYELLFAFVKQPHQILGREYLLQLTKNSDLNPFDRRIDVQISRLRQKIELDAKRPVLIKTVRNKGYLFTSKVSIVKNKSLCLVTVKLTNEYGGQNHAYSSKKRQYLVGKIGDKINAVLAGCGFNLRKILNCIKLNQTCFA